MTTPATTNPSSTGAVIGVPINTNPATTKATGAGLLGVIGGAVLTVYSALAKNPSTVHWVSTLTGGGVGLGSVVAIVMVHIRAFEAEAQHAISAVEAKTAPVLGTTPTALSAEVNAEAEALIGKIRAAAGGTQTLP